MKHSQYLDAYLDGNSQRIKDGDKPITIGTFINQQLRGRAKKYAMKYAGALHRSCIDVLAAEVPSKGGGRAFIRRSDAPPHFHTCDQCDKEIGELCYCALGNILPMLCSACKPQ